MNIAEEIKPAYFHSRQLSNYPVYARDYFHYMHTRIVKDKGIDISSKYYIGNFSEIYETLVEDYSQT